MAPIPWNNLDLDAISIQYQTLSDTSWWLNLQEKNWMSSCQILPTIFKLKVFMTQKVKCQNMNE